MRKYSVAVLAAVVALLVVAPAVAATPAGDEDLLVCPAADLAAEAPDLVPSDPEAAPDEVDLDIEEAMNPEPMPAFCPTNLRCTFFCQEFEKCPTWECIGGFCHYYL